MSDPNRTAEKARLREEREQRHAAALANFESKGVRFQPFPKIPRLNRNIIITEKIDGTNAAIHITDKKIIGWTGVLGDTQGPFPEYEDISPPLVVAQSRTRLLTTEEDNFGFAKWVEQNAQALREVLGNGLHFGEWWGQGVQRGYRQTRKWFSLFDYTRWSSDPSVASLSTIGVQVVPVLYTGPWMAVVGGSNEVYPVRNEDGTFTGVLRFAPDLMLEHLSQRGSVAATVGLEPNGTPVVYKKNSETGDKGAEGIVVFHEKGGIMFKATLENDEQPKTVAEVEHEKWLDEIGKEPI
jgi:hypothetical protein